jgi:hypothetical protein
MRASGFSFRQGFVFDRSLHRGRMRYDPDVAVSRCVPPLFLPYFRKVWGDVFGDGAHAFEHENPVHPLLDAAPLAFVLLAGGGWAFLPATVYGAFLILYGAAVALSAFSYFSLRLALPVAAGIVGEHLVRAAAFPAGVLAGLARMMRKAVG